MTGAAWVPRLPRVATPRRSSFSGAKESLTAYGAPLGYAAGMARPAWPGG